MKKTKIIALIAGGIAGCIFLTINILNLGNFTFIDLLPVALFTFLFGFLIYSIILAIGILFYELTKTHKQDNHSDKT
jgi:hypothetical protein